MTIAERIDRMEFFRRDGRLIQGGWHGEDDDGRETACLLGSLGPDIKDESDCPAELMPVWVAKLTVAINDNVSEEYFPEFARRYADLVRQFHVLDESAWRRVDLAVRRAALVVALPHDTGVVQPVIDLIDRELSGDRPPRQSEWAAARDAARAAASAASAAAWDAASAAASDSIADYCLSAIESEIERANHESTEGE